MNEEMMQALYAGLGLEEQGVTLDQFSTDMQGNNEMQQAVMDALELSSNGVTLEQFQTDLFGAQPGASTDPAGVSPADDAVAIVDMGALDSSNVAVQESTQVAANILPLDIKVDNEYTRFTKAISPYDTQVAEVEGGFFTQGFNFLKDAAKSVFNPAGAAVDKATRNVVQKKDIEAINEQKQKQVYSALPPEGVPAVAPETLKEVLDTQGEHSSIEYAKKIKIATKKHTSELSNIEKFRYDKLSTADREKAEALKRGEALPEGTKISDELSGWFNAAINLGDQHAINERTFNKYNDILKSVTINIKQSKDQDLSDDKTVDRAVSFLEDYKRQAIGTPEEEQVRVVANEVIEAIQNSNVTDSVAGSYAAGLWNTLKSSYKAVDTAFSEVSVERKLLNNLFRGSEDLDLGAAIGDEAKAGMVKSLQDTLTGVGSKYDGAAVENILKLKDGRIAVLDEEGEVDFFRNEDGTRQFVETKQDAALKNKIASNRGDLTAVSELETTSPEQTTGGTKRLMFKIGQVGVDMIPMIAGSALTGGSMAGIMVGTSSVMYGDFFEQALEETGDVGQAAMFASIAAPAIGFVEARIGKLESKLGRAISGGEKRAIYDVVLGEAKTAADAGLRQFVTNKKGIVPRFQEALGKATSIADDIKGELIEEFSNIPVEQLARTATGLHTEMPSNSELTDTFVLTTGVSAIFGGGRAGLESFNNQQFEELIGTAAANKNTFMQMADEYIEGGRTPEEKASREKESKVKLDAIEKVDEAFRFIDEAEITNEQAKQISDLAIKEAKFTILGAKASSGIAKRKYEKAATTVGTALDEVYNKIQLGRFVAPGERVATEAYTEATAAEAPTGAEAVLDDTNQPPIDAETNEELPGTVPVQPAESTVAEEATTETTPESQVDGELLKTKQQQDATQEEVQEETNVQEPTPIAVEGYARPIVKVGDQYFPTRANGTPMTRAINPNSKKGQAAITEYESKVPTQEATTEIPTIPEDQIVNDNRKEVASNRDAAAAEAEIIQMMDVGRDATENNLSHSVTSVSEVGGRKVAEVTFENGAKVLFYKSLGAGSGKESTGQWVPIPGFAQNGWFIKGTAQNKLDKYDIPVFQEIAEELKQNEPAVAEDPDVVSGEDITVLDDTNTPENQESPATETLTPQTEGLTPAFTDFDSPQEREARAKAIQEKREKDAQELTRLSDEFYRANRAVTLSDPETQVAADNAKKAYQQRKAEIEAEKKQVNDQRNLATLIESAVDAAESTPPTNEELAVMNEDIRQAALAEAKDMLEFVKSEDNDVSPEERAKSIAVYEQDIDLLERAIASDAPPVTLADYRKVIENQLNSVTDPEVQAYYQEQVDTINKLEQTTQDGEVQSDAALANEIAVAADISLEQGQGLASVVNKVYKNIAKRMGTSLKNLKRSIAFRTVPNISEFIRNIPENSIALRGLSSDIISDLTNSTTDNIKVNFQEVFSRVLPKYIKNLSLQKNDFILSALLEMDKSFAFLGFGKPLAQIGNKEAIIKELETRFNDIYDRAANSNDFYVQELSKSFLNSQLEAADTQLKKDAVQALLDGDERMLDAEIDNLQNQQRQALLESLDYLKQANQYPIEFKYLMAGVVLRGNVAKDIQITDSQGNVTKTIKGEKAKRNNKTIGNHQELSSMVLPEVYDALKNGSTLHPMKLIDKHTDKSYISKDETWEIIKDRIDQETPDGYWVKFDKSSNETDITGLQHVSKKVAKVMPANPWCTGGGMASSYLPQGDFYIFLDKNLEPQITVRYSNGQIAEVKGTGAGQVLTKEQAVIAKDKLTDIPNGKAYTTQVATTSLYYKLKDIFDGSSDPSTRVKDFTKEEFEALLSPNSLETYDSDAELEYATFLGKMTPYLNDINNIHKLHNRIVPVDSISDFDSIVPEKGDYFLMAYIDFDHQFFNDNPDFKFEDNTTFSGEITWALGMEIPETFTFGDNATFTDKVVINPALTSMRSRFRDNEPVSGKKVRTTSIFGKNTTFEGRVNLAVERTDKKDFRFSNNTKFKNGIAIKGLATEGSGGRILPESPTIFGDNTEFYDRIRVDNINNLKLGKNFKIKGDDSFALNVNAAKLSPDITFENQNHKQYSLNFSYSSIDASFKFPKGADISATFTRSTTRAGFSFPENLTTSYMDLGGHTHEGGQLFSDNSVISNLQIVNSNIEGRVFGDNTTFNDLPLFVTGLSKNFTFGDNSTINFRVRSILLNKVYNRLSLDHSGKVFGNGTTFTKEVSLSNLNSSSIPFEFGDNTTFNAPVSVDNSIIPDGSTFGKNPTFTGGLRIKTSAIPLTFKFDKGTKVEGTQVPPLQFRDNYSKGYPREVSVTDVFESLDSLPFLTEEERTALQNNTSNGRVAFQEGRGAIIQTPQSTLILLDKDNADVTTPIHEIAHKYEDVLTEEETKTVEDWSGHKRGTKGFREAFAKGAEKYIYEGVTFNNSMDEIFQKLKEWFGSVIQDAVSYFGDINQLTPEIRDVYAKMLSDGDVPPETVQEAVSETGTPEEGVQVLEDVTELVPGFEFIRNGKPVEIAPQQPGDANTTVRIRAKGSKNKGSSVSKTRLAQRLNNPDNTKVTRKTARKKSQVQTVLEPIGKTTPARAAQFKKFFKLTDRQATAVSELYNTVARTLGDGKNPIRWLSNRIAAIGQMSTEEATKRGAKFQVPEYFNSQQVANRVADNLTNHLTSLIEKGRTKLNREPDATKRAEITRQIEGLQKVLNQVKTQRTNTKWKAEDGTYRGAVIEGAKHKLILAALESPDISTAVHELFHIYENDLTPEQKQVLIDAYNENAIEEATEVTTDVSEYGARLWENYWANGKELTKTLVPNSNRRSKLQKLFDEFNQWLTTVAEYVTTGGKKVPVKLNDSVREMFDSIVGINPPQPEPAYTETAEEVAEQAKASRESRENPPTDDGADQTSTKFKTNHKFTDREEVRISNVFTEGLRKDLGLNRLPSTIEQTWESVYNFVIAKGLYDKADVFASIVLQSDKMLDVYEIAAIHIKLTMLTNRVNEIDKDMAKATGPGLDAIVEERAELATMIDDLTAALRATGTSTARALSIRQMALRKSEITAASLTAIAEKYAGRPLTNEEQQEINKAFNDITEAKQKVDAAEVAAEEDQKSTLMDIVEGVIENTKKSPDAVSNIVDPNKKTAKREELDQEFNDLKKEFKDLGKRLNSASRFAADGLAILTKMAINRIKAGTLSFTTLVAELQEVAPDITETDVATALAAADLKKIAETDTRLRETLKQYKATIKLMDKIEEDMAKIDLKKEADRATASAAIKKIRAALTTLLTDFNNRIRDDVTESAHVEKLEKIVVKIEEIETHIEKGTLPKVLTRKADHPELKKYKQALKEARADLNKHKRYKALVEEANSLRPGSLTYAVKGGRKHMDQLNRQLEEARNLVADIKSEKRTREAIDKYAKLIKEAGSPPPAKARRERLESLENAKEQLSSLKSILRAEDKERKLIEAIKKVKAGDMSGIDQINEIVTPKPGKKASFEVRVARENLRTAKIQAVKIARDMSKKDLGAAGKTWLFIGEAWEAARSVKATLDLSGTLRQGLYMAVSHPVLAARAFDAAIRGMVNADKGAYLMNSLRDDPRHRVRVAAGLKMTDMTDILDAEELYGSEFVKKWFPGAKMSERHMVIFLNYLRASVFDNFAENNRGIGLPALKQYAKWVNHASGIMSDEELQGWAGSAASAGGVIFFAPKFTFSRFMIVSDVANTVGSYVGLGTLKNDAVRYEMTKDILKAATGMAGIIGLATMFGFSFGDDPRESDFMKLRKGQTTIDIFAGVAQVGRLGMQLVTKGFESAGWIDESKSPLHQHFNSVSPPEIFGRFLWYKGHPGVSLTGSFAFRQDAIGREISYKEAAIKAVLPISIENIWETGQVYGYASPEVVAYTALDMLGVGTTSIDDPTKIPEAKPIWTYSGYKPKPSAGTREGSKWIKENEDVKEEYERAFRAIMTNIAINNVDVARMRPEEAKEYLQEVASDLRPHLDATFEQLRDGGYKLDKETAIRYYKAKIENK